MKGDIPLKSGDEHDALTGWRKVMRWKAGQIKRIKRRYNKRVRRRAKHSIQQQANDLA